MTFSTEILPESWSAGPSGGADALSCFDSLSGLEPEFMIGQWRGAGLPTAHPLDGVLEALGWYGKAFETVDRVHPLLFRTHSGGVIPLDPRFMPVRVALLWPALAKSALVRAAFAAGRPLLRAHHSAAKLRAETFRGKRGAAMIYDRQPITDHFRRIDDNRVLGLMEARDMERPFFFLLTRVQPLSGDDNDPTSGHPDAPLIHRISGKAGKERDLSLVALACGQPSIFARRTFTSFAGAASASAHSPKTVVAPSKS